MKTIYGSAFYVTKKIGVNVKSSKTDVYFKCICVFFASLNRFHLNDRKELFVNTRIPQKYTEILKSYNVEITIVPEKYFSYVSSDKLSNSFPGCLFSLDIFKYLEERSEKYREFEGIVLLDNDTLLLKKIDAFFPKIAGVKIKYDFNKDVNGKSRSTLSCVNGLIGNNNFVDWYGGEFIYVNFNFLNEFNQEVQKYFNFCETNAMVLGEKLTEEHIFSLIITNNIKNNPDNFLKRVWTTYGYNNISGDEKLYTILHYPSEKNRLFIKLFSFIEKKEHFLSDLKDENYTKLILEPIDYFMKNSFGLRLKKFLALIKRKTLIIWE